MKIGDTVKGSEGLPDGTVVTSPIWSRKNRLKIKNGEVVFGTGGTFAVAHDLEIVSLPEQEVTYKLVVTLSNGCEDTYDFNEDCDIETEDGGLTICTDGVFAAVYAPGKWKSAVRKEIKA